MKDSIDKALSKFNTIKLESEKKAKGLVKENKGSMLLGCFNLLLIGLIGALVIGAIWFFLTN